MAMKTPSGLASQLRRGATIALATATLTTCNKDGAVDPAPPPADCNFPSTTELDGYGYKDDASGDLVISLSSSGEATYSATTITDVMGATLVSVSPDGMYSIQVKLRPNPPTATSGTFHVKTTVTDRKMATCSVEKTFTFTVTSSGVTVRNTRVAQLPLTVRYPASIAMVAHDGHTLELAGRTGYRGAQTIDWSVTGGVIEAQSEGRLRWRLPDEPGLYQVELVIDYGEGGFAIDHMTFEVARASAEVHP